MMKKTLFLLTTVASLTIARADEEKDLLRAEARWEGHLNQVWNETLTPAQRDALRADERKWIIWKDSLSLSARVNALGDRVDFLRNYARTH